MKVQIFKKIAKVKENSTTLINRVAAKYPDSFVADSAFCIMCDEEVTTWSNTRCRKSKFTEDLIKCILQFNILLHKVCKNGIIVLFKKYTEYPITSEPTLQNSCVPKLFNECLDKIRDKAALNYLWVSLDESTDFKQSYVANFLFEFLGVENEREKSFSFVKIFNRVNHSTKGALFDECINDLHKYKKNITSCFCTCFVIWI